MDKVMSSKLEIRQTVVKNMLLKKENLVFYQRRVFLDEGGEILLFYRAGLKPILPSGG